MKTFNINLTDRQAFTLAQILTNIENEDEKNICKDILTELFKSALPQQYVIREMISEEEVHTSSQCTSVEQAAYEALTNIGYVIHKIN